MLRSQHVIQQWLPASASWYKYPYPFRTTTDISAFPVTKEGVNRLIGNPEVTQALLAKGPQIQVFANLQPDISTYSKFKWSSSQGPQLKISAGTSTTVRVTVEERAPITFVLPILRSWSGLS